MFRSHGKKRLGVLCVTGQTLYQCRQSRDSEVSYFGLHLMGVPDPTEFFAVVTYLFGMYCYVSVEVPRSVNLRIYWQILEFTATGW